MERHPNAVAHFALAYVLRYGGSTRESAHECDAALSLDGNYQFRSCLFTLSNSKLRAGMDSLSSMLGPNGIDEPDAAFLREG